MQSSGAKPYPLKNTNGVYSCSCPARRNQSIAIEMHLLLWQEIADALRKLARHANGFCRSGLAQLL
jgi:hypothetical protein